MKNGLALPIEFDDFCNDGAALSHEPTVALAHSADLVPRRREAFDTACTG